MEKRPCIGLTPKTFQIESLRTSGNHPGWVYKHRATLIGTHKIQITGGQIVTEAEGAEVYSENAATFILNIENLLWSVNNTS